MSARCFKSSKSDGLYWRFEHGDHGEVLGARNVWVRSVFTSPEDLTTTMNGVIEIAAEDLPPSSQ